MIIISKKNKSQRVEVLEVYLSRKGGYYEIGLNHPVFREFIKFGQKEDEPETVFFDVTPKYKSRTSKMLLNYEDHPNIIFDGFVRIFLEVRQVIQESGEEYDAYEDD